MCGISGFLGLDRRPDVPAIGLGAANVIGRMSAALAHRGPDDDGFYASPDGRCRLGHRRLSVIDLGRGHQPLANEDGTVVTVFNGEIYNYRELRAELEGQGHRFATNSDTEVLVHGWEQHGPAVCDRLRGMFAFAVWDDRQQTLFAAVDPLGKKPLYWTALGGVLRFGSELKALMADPALPREVDPDAVNLYLHLGYVPHPWTILKDVQKLPPGHRLTVRDGRVTVDRYWDVPRRPTYAGSFDDACRELRSLVTDAVRRRLVADVPLGAFLSGGVDSTIVVGLMSELLDRPVRTFTIGFDEKRFDESAFARVAAARFRTDHRELTVRPDALGVLPMLAHHFDEPFGDSSAIPTYYVSKLTREHVTVALTGDGGDEAFGGYRRYRRGKLAGWLGRVPGGRRVAGLGRHLIPAAVDRMTDLGRARRSLSSLAGPPADAYFEQMTQFGGGTMGRLLSRDFVARVDADLPRRWFASLYAGTDPADPAGADMAVDLQSYLPGDILTKVDRASMAVALECRSPFLDRDVVAFAASLPTAWRLRGFAGHKHVLKRAFADLLPPAVANRRKAGFAVPLPDWFRGPLRGLLRDTLLDATARGRGYTNPAEVERLVVEHEAGARNHAGSLWTLLMLEMWHRTWATLD
ncbi:MAG: asnB 3 [Phycisphaerales bacterium]|nr:asnB 3 [Phycisphaerales bacterium]